MARWAAKQARGKTQFWLLFFKMKRSAEGSRHRAGVVPCWQKVWWCMEEETKRRHPAHASQGGWQASGVGTGRGCVGLAAGGRRAVEREQGCLVLRSSKREHVWRRLEVKRGWHWVAGVGWWCAGRQEPGWDVVAVGRLVGGPGCAWGSRVSCCGHVCRTWPGRPAGWWRCCAGAVLFCLFLGCVLFSWGALGAKSEGRRWRSTGSCIVISAARSWG